MYSLGNILTTGDGAFDRENVIGKQQQHPILGHVTTSSRMFLAHLSRETLHEFVENCPKVAVICNVNWTIQDGAPKIAFSCLVVSGLSMVYGRYIYITIDNYGIHGVNLNQQLTPLATKAHPVRMIL